VTVTEENLIRVGNHLARSIGHHFGHGCPKISHAVPCTCGASKEQAQALADWSKLMDDIEELYAP
jgi:hypothetical protein